MACCRGETRCCGNMLWEYLESKAHYNFNKEKLGFPSFKKIIVCVETGKNFNTLKEAANAVGLKSIAHISQCCNGKIKICGGYHWIYKTIDTI